MFSKNFMFYFVCLVSIFLTSLFFGSTSFAHVTILQPKSGDVIDGGTEFPIKWQIDEAVAQDTNFDIRFSRDGGTNWEVVTTNLESTIREFNWLVPDINTTQGRMEIIEDRASGEDDGGRTGTFTIKKAGSKLFTFNCAGKIKKWVFGLEKLEIDLGDEQSCVLKLTNLEPGVEVEVSTKLRKGIRPSIDVTPRKDIVDQDGILEILITGINAGIDWVAWAIQDSNGKFSFTKDAYDDGTAWGMFVDVR